LRALHARSGWEHGQLNAAKRLHCRGCPGGGGAKRTKNRRALEIQA